MSDFKSLHQGVEMILKQIHQLLTKNGIKEIKCLGKPFNPAQQEAIAHIETDKHPENTVIEEVRKGYLIEDRLLRPAIVKVSKKVQKK
jgi:molecular chaperone GrpE